MLIDFDRVSATLPLCLSESATPLWHRLLTRSSTASRTCLPSPPPRTSSSSRPGPSRSSSRTRASSPRSLLRLPRLPLRRRQPPLLPRRRRRKSRKRRTTTWASVSSIKTRVCQSVYVFSLAVEIYCFENITWYSRLFS